MRQVALLCSERARLAEALGNMPGVTRVWPSEANFLLVSCEDPERMLDAGVAGGLLVRDVRRYPGLDHCLRITIGSPEQNDRLLSALEVA